MWKQISKFHSQTVVFKSFSKFSKLMADCDIIEGTRVILQKADEYKSCVVQKNSLIRMGKVRFNLDGLIGKMFGTLLEVEDGNLVPIVQVPETQQMDMQGCSTDRSNQNLQESDDNQKIKERDILQMKASGVSGEQIVEKLVENSQTFKNKTEFSQNKYIKKKQDKHVSILRVLKPTTRLVFEMFYKKNPGDIGYMRIDTFSQILSFANIIPDSHIGVIDTYRGLLVPAVLEQLGGTGGVVQLIPDGVFLTDCLKYYNLSEQSLNSHYHYHINSLGTLAADINKDETGSQTSMATTSVVAAADGMECESSGDLVIDYNQSANGNPTQIAGVELNSRKRKRDEKKQKTPEEMEAEKQHRQNNFLKRKQAQQILLDKDLDGLILSCKFHPTPLVMRMIDFINPSRPVVVYSQNQEPLIDCYMKVKGSGKGVNLQITETWYREYQVLPQRTHPVVKMSGTGGYLLTFYTADSATS